MLKRAFLKNSCMVTLNQVDRTYFGWVDRGRPFLNVVCIFLRVPFFAQGHTPLYVHAHLKALCHNIRLDCFVIASLVEKSN